MNDEESDDLEHCAICLDFQNCESISMECCNKLIHSYCLSEWMQTRNNCPLCRTQQSSYYNNLSRSNNNSEISSLLPNFENYLNEIRNSIGITSIQNYDNLIGVTNIRFNRFQNRPRQRIRRQGFYIPRDEYMSQYRPIMNNFDFDDFDNIMNDIDNGVTMYENDDDVLGVSYASENLLDMGITSFNIEIERNNNPQIHLNLNGDLNININNLLGENFQRILNLLNDIDGMNNID